MRAPSAIKHSNEFRELASIEDETRRSKYIILLALPMKTRHRTKNPKVSPWQFAGLWPLSVCSLYSFGVNTTCYENKNKDQRVQE